MGFDGNNTSICDKDGNLLFYTNGRAIINRHHLVMPNGDSINAGVWAEKFWKDPFDGYPGAQDVLILPNPGNDYGFYLFHKINIYYQNIQGEIALTYSYIDMRLNNGDGDVVFKNKKYYIPENTLRYYFTALSHENKKDWWIIQPIAGDSVYLTFLIEEKGIIRKENQNSHQFFTRNRSSASGMARFSPDGTKYALYNYYDQLHIYDFDRATGELSNHKKVYVIPHDSINNTDIIFSSVEWSPNSRFIYTASTYKIHQVDLWASNIQESIEAVAIYDGSQDPFNSVLNFVALGPDCRIYITPKSGSNSLSIINHPNEKGLACGFVQNGIKLPYPNGGSLPNFPRFRVDEEDKCDSTITSIFGETVYYRRDLEVFPNPSNGLFTIKLSEIIHDANLVVTNINGQVIYKKEIRNSIIEEIDITNQVAGHYNIEVYPDENKERIFYGKQMIKIE